MAELTVVPDEPENQGELALAKTLFGAAHSGSEGSQRIGLMEDYDYFDSEMIGTYHGIEGMDREGKGITAMEFVVSDGVILGVLVCNEEGQQFFLPREPGMDTQAVVNAVRKMVGDKSMDVVDGVLSRKVGRTRRAVSSLEILDEDKPPRIGKKRIVFDVPEEVEPSLLATAARCDTDEKRAWRTSLLHFAKEIFGKIEDIPPRERYVLCFPGLRQEACLWKSFGFTNYQMIFIEKNPRLAEELADHFRGAKVLCTAFQSGKTVYKQVKAYMGKGGKLSILSIDPNNQWSQGFQKGFQDFIDDPLISDNALVSMCFSSGRGEDVAWWQSMMREVMAERHNSALKGPFFSPNDIMEAQKRIVEPRDFVLPPMTLDELRLQVVEYALAYTLRKCLLGGDLSPDGYYQQRLLNKGRYRGDGSQYMYFAMHHVTKQR